MYKLYDSYPDSPALVGTFESVDEAREAARKLDEATGWEVPTIEPSKQNLFFRKIFPGIHVVFSDFFFHSISLPTFCKAILNLVIWSCLIILQLFPNSSRKIKVKSTAKVKNANNSISKLYFNHRTMR